MLTLLNKNNNSTSYLRSTLKFCNSQPQSSSPSTTTVNNLVPQKKKTSIDPETITRIINDHPFPDQPLHPVLLHHLSPPTITTRIVGDVLGRLFASHCNGLKALEFFKFTLLHSQLPRTPDSLEKTLHTLTRMRYFDKAWSLLKEIGRIHPSLLTLKSMSIMLSKVVKFHSFEDTLEAFRRMEDEVSVGRLFGTDEFNVLVKAFCTQRLMKEATSVFVKMVSRFSENTKTMNILPLGFKELGDLTSV